MRRARPFKHNCAAFGCKTQVPFRWLMCEPHWAKVPAELQAAVYSAYETGVRSPAWTKAVSAAIGSVTVQAELFA